MTDPKKKYEEALASFAVPGNRWSALLSLTYWAAASGLDTEQVLADAHGLVALKHRADVVGDLIGTHHQAVQLVLGHPAVGGDEAGDALLHITEALVSLRGADDSPVDAYRMHRHGRGRHDEGMISGHGQRHADGMPPAEHQRHDRLGHRRDQLRERKPRLHVTAHRVQHDQQPVCFLVLLDRHEQRDQLLILGRLLPLRQQVVSLHLPNDRKTVD